MLIGDVVILHVLRSYPTNRRNVGYILLSVQFRYASVNCTIVNVNGTVKGNYRNKRLKISLCNVGKVIPLQTMCGPERG